MIKEIYIARLGRVWNVCSNQSLLCPYNCSVDYAVRKSRDR